MLLHEFPCLAASGAGRFLQELDGLSGFFHSRTRLRRRRLHIFPLPYKTPLKTVPSSYLPVSIITPCRGCSRGVEGFHNNTCLLQFDEWTLGFRSQDTQRY